MEMNMDLIPSGIRSEIPLSPPLSRPGNHEPVNKPLHATNQREQLPVWDVPSDSAESGDSTSASASSLEQETSKNGGDCDQMIEKWRLIKLADKNRARKKVADAKADIPDQKLT